MSHYRTTVVYVVVEYFFSQFSYSTWSIWEGVVSTSDKLVQLCRRNHVHNFSGWYLNSHQFMLMLILK